MGVVSLLAPLLGPKLLRPFTPGRGRYGRAVVVGAAGAVVLTTAADAVVRRSKLKAPVPGGRLRQDGFPPPAAALSPSPAPALGPSPAWAPSENGNGTGAGSDNGPGSTHSSNTDASNTDASNTDASNTDASNTDASNTDASSTHSSNTDASNTDASNTDASNTDASNTDASNTDASNTDASNTDASNTDAMNTDSIGATPEAEPIALRAARRVAAVGGVTAVVAGGVAITTTWTSLTTAHRLWKHRILPDVGRGPLALAAAIAGWDLLYYWDHRFMHSSRYMWAIHVVHHSSEHYNLSTALRQPVAEAFGTFVPFGSLCLFGVRPGLVESARGANLLYQYWIHTETVGRLGPGESVLNTPSHHRVHHACNPPYVDRNFGGVLIVFDRLFGTFTSERADDPPRYGLIGERRGDHPLRILFGGWARLWAALRARRGLRARAACVLGLPSVAGGPGLLGGSGDSSSRYPA
jgi:sterol desaturase/sphingolipid hydroxylase (fatty acid hydroxylase superfamily)